MGFVDAELEREFVAGPEPVELEPLGPRPMDFADFFSFSPEDFTECNLSSLETVNWMALDAFWVRK